jgi:pimeloyl-ACP methyl ester carboxylesterase
MKLAHDISGSGPTLVLVHGVTHRRQGWDVLLDRLTPYRRVVTVDLPGHGESPAVGQPPNMLEFLTDELSAFVADVTPEGERAHVAGNSLGGWLALALAARGEVVSATALSPAGFFVNRLDQKRARATFVSIRTIAKISGKRLPQALQFKAIRYAALAPFFAKPSRISYEDALVDSRSLMANEVLDPLGPLPFVLPAVVDPAIPVTVAWGRRDLVLPVYQARRVLEQFPAAQLSVLPRLGHVPMSDDPALIAKILLDGSSAASSTTKTA